jgi:hypothetical protein
MTCAEFQAVLPELLEGGGTAEHNAHLAICPACSGLVSDIHSISEQASFLRASDEPSPRVWNSIEIVLRQEGLIREPGADLLPDPGNPAWRWTVAWLLPATAAFLITFGLLRYERPPAVPQIAEHSAPAPEAISASLTAASASQAAANPKLNAPADLNDDQQLLEEVSSSSPAVRASYENNLRHVNEYIRDAEQSAKAHPDDEEAQQYLMNAYEQKAMVYELAMDRSLP